MKQEAAKGRLVVIEGLDGSGKATQAALLLDELRERFAGEKKVLKISFPDYQNPSSTLVKLYLNGEIGSLDEVNPFAASSFYSLDRYISYKTIWGEDYRNGAVVVADRYTTSNLSYQMVKCPREEWLDYIRWLSEFEYGKLGLPQPGLVVYLDMHPEASRKLISARYSGDERKRDLHEADFDYLTRCRDAALFAAETLGWKVIPCSDKARNPLLVEQIRAQVRRVVDRWLYKEI